MPVDARELLARITDTHLARVVPLLPASALQGAVRQLGLQSCSELLALATPEQLAAVFDLDLWRADRAGGDDQFEASRFCEWLEMMIEGGAPAAADRLASLDGALIVVGLSPHIAVFDPAALPSFAERALSCDIGGYVVVERRRGHWEAITLALAALEERHRERFHEIMRGCRRLSNSAPEADGFHDLAGTSEQSRFDLGVLRDGRREAEGFVAPADARAFLAGARRKSSSSSGQANPILRAYLRVTGPGAVVEEVDGGSRAADVAAVIDVLREAGAVHAAPRALLRGDAGAGTADAAGPLARITGFLEAARERDPSAYLVHMEAFAFLSNVLMAGGVVQGRAFTAREAADAAAAVCNLGLEYAADEDLSAPNDVVACFERGWAALHRDVVMLAAERVLDALARLRTRDRSLQVSLHALQAQLSRQWRSGMPWLAQDALEALALLDLPTWAALRALIDECPVMLTNVRRSSESRLHAIDPVVFEFVSERRHVASIRAFLESLPDRLTC